MSGPLALALSLLLAPPAPAATSPPVLRIPEKELAAERYTFVSAVAKLPADVRAALARQLGEDPLRMADAGAPFNATDVITDASQPGRRLILAALGDHFAVVHFEQGGVEHTRWVVLFERAAQGLNVLWHGVVEHTYGDARELESAIRTGSLWKAPVRR